MGSPRVLVTDPLADAGLEALRERGLELDVQTGLTPEQLIKAVRGAEALIVRSGTQVTAEVFEAADRLRIVGRAGVGVDNIDHEAATQHGVLVTNTPTGNTLAATEHTMAMMLAVARNVPQAHRALQEGRWERKEWAGVELAEKTLGIVGLGRIGREVAARARSFQMRIVGYDPFLNAETAKALGVELLELDEVVEQADFLTLHTPLTPDTRHLFDAERLGRMKPEVRIINVSRGGVIDEQALADAIREGRVAGAALDVFEDEPPTDSPLLGLDEVVTTPHLGASTVEAQEKVAVQVARQVADYLLDSRVRNATNLPNPPDAALQPWLDLAQAMGSFARQTGTGQPSRVTVDCRGEVARLATHSLADAALVGVLERASDQRVTLVNADQHAQKLGIQVVRSASETSEDYTSSLRVTLTTDHGDVTLLGTHLARLGARIVEVNGFDVEFKPNGRFLVVPHRDQPGTVARISAVLGAHNVNIAQMVVGRRAPRGEAVSILRVDDPVEAKALDELKATLGTPEIRVVEVAPLEPDAEAPEASARAQ